MTSGQSTFSLPPRPANAWLTTALCALCLVIGVSAAHATKRRAFVTSEYGSGNLSTWAHAGGFSGVAAGDQVCKSLAALRGLPNASAYRAWLSDQQTDAYCHARGQIGKKGACQGGPVLEAGPWYLVDGASPFTSDLDTLTGSRAVIYRAVLADETGLILDPDDAPNDNRYYWTGTFADGRAGHTCNSWGSSNIEEAGTFGHPLGSAVAWTTFTASSCDASNRLLCLEAGASETIHLAWTGSAQLAFVTSGTGTGDLGSWPDAGGKTGLAAGDAICRAHAARANLPSPEKFVAWLSDSSTDAKQRWTAGPVVKRVDGYPLAGLTGNQITNSIHVDEFGRYLLDPSNDASLAPQLTAWTGTDGYGTKGYAANCIDWQVDSFIGSEGSVVLAFGDRWTFDEPVISCNQFRRLYCLSTVATSRDPMMFFADGFESGDLTGWSSHSP